MGGQYQIKSVSDIRCLGLVKEPLSDVCDMWISKGVNPLGMEAVFKCKDTTANEVFGYVLAAKTGMPVTDFKGFWFENEFVHPNKTVWPVGTVGLLVKKLTPSCEISLYGAVQMNAKIAAKNLLMRLFLGGGEYPQMLVFGSKLFFYDLEFIGPQMLADDSDEVLWETAEQYVKGSAHQMEKVMRLVLECDVHSLFLEVFMAIKETVTSSNFKSQALVGHPRSEIMSKAFFIAIANRYEKCQKLLVC